VSGHGADVQDRPNSREDSGVARARSPVVAQASVDVRAFRHQEGTAEPGWWPFREANDQRPPQWWEWALDRLPLNSEPDGDCLIWQSRRTKAGYPMISIVGQSWPAHRLSAALAFGMKAVRGRHVHHTCERKLCISHLHLVPLTANDHAKVHRKDTVCPPPPRHFKWRKVPDLAEFERVVLGERDGRSRRSPLRSA
jgi:hypothetical protein